MVVFLYMDASLSEWSLFDLGQLSQSLMLAAKAHGLDSVPAYSMVSYPQHVREILDVPHHLKVVLGIAVGYGDHDHFQNQYRTSRVPLEDVVRFKGI